MSEMKGNEFSRTITVTTEFNNELLIQSVKTGQDIIERTAFDVVKLKERGIREALIAMGWTPPPDDEQVEP